MRYAVTSSTRTLVGVIVVVCCCLRVGVALAEDVGGGGKPEGDSNEQLDMSKRSWTKGNTAMMHSWGKRAWQNLQGGWGKRDPWGPASSYPLYVSDKRAWQNLQGGWGKRFATDEEYAAKLAALLADEELQQRLAEYAAAVGAADDVADGNNEMLANNINSNDDDKRGWRSLNNAGWGKRTQWNSFHGGWGKRDPAWTNLKGIWGKRSVEHAGAGGQ